MRKVALREGPGYESGGDILSLGVNSKKDVAEAMVLSCRCMGICAERVSCRGAGVNARVGGVVM
jgi:hypothetical protein